MAETKPKPEPKGKTQPKKAGEEAAAAAPEGDRIAAALESICAQLVTQNALIQEQNQLLATGNRLAAADIVGQRRTSENRVRAQAIADQHLADAE